MSPKQRAAEAALQFVRSGMVLGLGTGSTAEQFLRALVNALRSGQLRDIRGVPTSRWCERHAQELGIPLATLAECPRPDLTVDGADEIAPNLDLIKGLGGALLREKMVAQASRQMIIIADSSKAVGRLGTRSPLPVEVIQFGHEAHVPHLRALGAEPKLRTTPDGKPFVTDNGNFIFDCRFPSGIGDPRQIESAILHRAGVVDCGLFLGMATLALIADDQTVRQVRRA